VAHARGEYGGGVPEAMESVWELELESVLASVWVLE
jgi:hypothetical protein